MMSLEWCGCLWLSKMCVAMVSDGWQRSVGFVAVMVFGYDDGVG
ncbi:hypothetical protein GYH30_006472 [Glycine max]|nr:hypothetical protein GYH30_006472 [Glycine max]